MIGYLKNHRKSRLLILLIAAAIVLAVFCPVLLQPAINAPTEFERLTGSVYLEHRFIAREGAVPLDLSENAVRLKKSENTLKSITFYYDSGGQWIEITNDSSELPADAGYQLKIEYDNIIASDLLAAGCQMVYEPLPDWFSPNETGVLIYGEDIVADIECKDSRIAVTFKEDWLLAQGSNNLHGFFKINGKVSWKQLPDGGDTLPDLDITLDFGSDLPSKYGSLSIEKNEPKLVQNGDSYYLRYEITVMSEEDSPIPGLYVLDTFTSSTSLSKQIDGYVGVSDGLDEPKEYFPRESSTEDGVTAGSLTVESGSMKWIIGELAPNEQRTLVYYARISQDYIDTVLNEKITNNAEVYSKDFLRDTDKSDFAPKGTVNLSKSCARSNLDDTGSGTLEYSITVTAPETNSFTLSNLKVNDFFPSYLDDLGFIKSVTIDSIDGEPVSGRSFPITGVTLAPGESRTISYTVEVANIFALGSGDIDLTNTASVTTEGGRLLRQTLHTETLTQNSWMRKSFGEPIGVSKTIRIPDTDEIYSSPSVPDDRSDISFEAPAGSLKYSVILNEDGRWDLSKAALTDTFVNEKMSYCGYLQVRIYEDPPVKSQPVPDDAALTAMLEVQKPFRTVWLDVDGLKSFSFTPTELGLPTGKYTYLLTYYGQLDNTANAAAYVASNSFEITGEVGYGNGGSAGSVQVTGMKFTVSGVVKNSTGYNVTKDGWYYEPSPVQNVVNSNDYKGGAVYWVIKVEGKIEAGRYEKNAENKYIIDYTNSPFVIKDKTGVVDSFKRDSVAGVFIGSNNFDLTQYSSYEDFLNKAVGEGEGLLKKMNGNPQNDQYFDGTAVNNPDYIWNAREWELSGFIFTSDYDLSKENKAIYIVLRTMAGSAPNLKDGTTYKNDVYINDFGDYPVDSAELRFTSAVYKESKGAYTYDAKKDEIKECSPSYTVGQDDWRPGTLDWDYIKANFGSGTYAPWLLNINWNGTMSGTVEVTDQLPKGMELVYCDILYLGRSVQNNPPICEEIPELNDDDSWIRLEKATVHGNAVTYYNPETREIRWKISNLTLDPAGDQTTRSYEMNLRIVCRVKDEKTFLSRQTVTYENQAFAGGEVYTATVDIDRKGCINKEIALNGDKNNSDWHNDENKLPFSIEVNQCAEDLCEGRDHLPALIDELSDRLLFIEGSLQIVDENGAPIRGYSYTVREDDNGRQTLVIVNLPDSKHFTIKYDTRVNAASNETVTGLGNNAYWDGYPSGDSQVHDQSFTYVVDGEVFSSEKISAEIIKVDSGNHMKKLEGAEFKIFEVQTDGALIKLIEKGSGMTDGSGKLVFDNDLYRNKVYCIQETNPPGGYKKDAALHYFAVIDTEHTKNDVLAGYPQYIIDSVELWYDSPEYTCVVPNDKGAISVDKRFMDENGDKCDPIAGSYSFGLFSSRGDTVPLEVLRIEYADNGLATYYLDGAETSAPSFSKYDPAMQYYIYELDAEGRPIANGGYKELNGVEFCVRYYDKDGNTSNAVTAVDGKIVVKNAAVKPDTPVELPSAGGDGVKAFALAGGMLALCSTAVFIMLSIYRKRTADI